MVYFTLLFYLCIISSIWFFFCVIYFTNFAGHYWINSILISFNSMQYVYLIALLEKQQYTVQTIYHSIYSIMYKDCICFLKHCQYRMFREGMGRISRFMLFLLYSIKWNFWVISFPYWDVQAFIWKKGETNTQEGAEGTDEGKVGGGEREMAHPANWCVKFSIATRGK